MKIGDLVRIKRNDSDIRGRNAGVILDFKMHHPDDSSAMIRIASVLWHSGVSWTQLDRLEQLKLSEF